MKRVVLLQSNYLPWRGFFDLIRLADEFIVYDSCQYTVNDWRNRNQIKTQQGLAWLTVPVLTKGRTGQRIDEAQVADSAWVAKHRRSVQQVLSKAPHAEWLDAQLDSMWKELAELSSLHDINLCSLRALLSALAVDTPMTLDRDHGELEEQDPSARVAELVATAGGTHYLTGPRGLDYLDRSHFSSRDLTLEAIDYSTLEPYPQLHGDFVGAVSVVDLLANTGPDARLWLTSGIEVVRG